MADNVAITAGAGTTIATDDDGTAHHQLVKIEFGANGTFTPVDATNPLPTRPLVDTQRVSVASSGLTTSATAYTAGDQVGTLFTFTNAARVSGGAGVVTGVAVVSAADTPTTMDLMLFEASVTLSGGDNGPFAISDADALLFVSLVQLTGFYDIGNNRVAFSYGLSVPYVCNGGTSLYGALITRGSIAATPFAAGTDIQVTLYVERA